MNLFNNLEKIISAQVRGSRSGPVTKGRLGFLFTFDLQSEMLMSTPPEPLPETHPFLKGLPLPTTASTRSLHLHLRADLELMPRSTDISKQGWLTKLLNKMCNDKEHS